MLFGQRFAHFSGDLSVGKVDLICYKNFGDIVTGVLLNLLEPVDNVHERLLLRAVVHENNPHGAFVVSLSDCPKALLPGCVPDLQLYSHVVNSDVLDLEVDS